MPLYEFHCNKCGKNFEELVYGDEKITCPKCGSGETSRLISACSHINGQIYSGDVSTASSCSSGRCSGCTGGHCSTCAH